MRATDGAIDLGIPGGLKDWSPGLEKSVPMRAAHGELDATISPGRAVDREARAIGTAVAHGVEHYGQQGSKLIFHSIRLKNSPTIPHIRSPHPNALDAYRFGKTLSRLCRTTVSSIVSLQPDFSRIVKPHRSILHGRLLDGHERIGAFRGWQSMAAAVRRQVGAAVHALATWRRTARNGTAFGSTTGDDPVTRSAINRPAPGPMPKPWPENPLMR